MEIKINKEKTINRIMEIKTKMTEYCSASASMSEQEFLKTCAKCPIAASCWVTTALFKNIMQEGEK